MSGQKPGPKGQAKIPIQIDETVAMGMYSNFMLINHNESEFVIDFAYLLPGPPRAKIGSRIILTPQHMKRVLDTLAKNVEKYEERFGPIKPAGAPDEQLVH